MFHTHRWIFKKYSVWSHQISLPHTWFPQPPFPCSCFPHTFRSSLSRCQQRLLITEMKQSARKTVLLQKNDLNLRRLNLWQMRGFVKATTKGSWITREQHALRKWTTEYLGGNNDRGTTQYSVWEVAKNIIPLPASLVPHNSASLGCKNTRPAYREKHKCFLLLYSSRLRWSSLFPSFLVCNFIYVSTFPVAIT